MQKSLLCILLSACVLLTVTQDFWTIAFYQANKDYISEVLCINKSDLSKSCKGRCFLKKKLQENRNNENKPILELSTQKVVFIIQKSILNLTIGQKHSKIVFADPQMVEFHYLKTQFRPPPALSM